MVKDNGRISVLTFSSSITFFKLLPIMTSANVLSSLENARNYHSYPHHIRKALTGNDDKISRVSSILPEMILHRTRYNAQWIHKRRC